MIRARDLDQVRQAELLPQATIKRPVSYFANRFGARLVEGHDDLDFFHGAGFVLNDMVPFALMHYRGYPENTTTVYLPFGIQGIDEISTIIARIAMETDIPSNAIIWRR